MHVLDPNRSYEFGILSFMISVGGGGIVIPRDVGSAAAHEFRRVFQTREGRA
jgi:hypothetical protein